jgi:hypothetical protein
MEYSDKPVTPFGGMVLMKRFLARLSQLAASAKPEGR